MRKPRSKVPMTWAAIDRDVEFLIGEIRQTLDRISDDWQSIAATGAPSDGLVARAHLNEMLVAAQFPLLYSVQDLSEDLKMAIRLAERT